MKKILIPTDFSANSDLAVKVGLEIAKAIKARIVFTYVSPIPRRSDAVPFSDLDLINTSEYQALLKFKHLEKKYHSKLSELEYSFKFEVGFPTQVIAKMAEDVRVDLVVLGTRGAKTKFKEMLGTTAYNIIKQDKCPVLAVPMGFHFKDLKKIALAVDYAVKRDYYIIEMLTSLAKALKSEIHIITLTNGAKDKVEKMNRRQMLMWTEFLRGINHHFHFIENGDIEKGILKYVKDNDIDMIAVTPSRLDLLNDLFHKSISKGLTYHSNVPVLV